MPPHKQRKIAEETLQVGFNLLHLCMAPCSSSKDPPFCRYEVVTEWNQDMESPEMQVNRCFVLETLHLLLLRTSRQKPSNTVGTDERGYL